MRNFVAGAGAMYVMSGAVVTWSLMAHTNGPCPWWLPPYWMATWLYQVIRAAVS